MKEKIFAIVGLCLYISLFSISLTSINFDAISSRWSNKLVVTELGFIGYALYDITTHIKTIYNAAGSMRKCNTWQDCPFAGTLGGYGKRIQAS